MARKRSAPLPGWANDPQYLAFESDIVAHPDDDAPRLILADWLDDHGDEHTAARAEFIRVQIELSRLDNHAPRWRELTQRQSELLRLHERAWLGPLAGIVTHATWQRGFVQRVKLGVRQFMDNADELFRQAPVLHLQLLRVSQTKLTMEELATCPHFARLRGLGLPGSGIGDDKLTVLLSQAKLEHLENLELESAGVGRRTMQVLARAALPKLRVLNLTSNRLLNTFEAFCQPTPGFQLRELAIANAELTEDDRAALFAWPGLAKVEKLNLGGNRLGTAGGVALARCPYLTSLRELDLLLCEIGARGMQAIADQRAFPDLQELHLRGNHIRPSGFAALLTCPFFSQLRSLRLHDNVLGDDSLEQLAAYPGLARLTALELTHNNVGPLGIEALCSSPYRGSLWSLELNMNPLTDVGAVRLAACEQLASLRRLELSMCELTDVGGNAILESPHLTKLERLRIGGNMLSPRTATRANERFVEATLGW